MSYEKNKIIGLLYRIFKAEEYTWHNNMDIGYEDINEFVKDLEDIAIEASDDIQGEAESGRIRVVYDAETKSFTYFFKLGAC